MRLLFRVLSLMADARAIRKGPAAVAKRQARKRAHRAVSTWLR